MPRSARPGSKSGCGRAPSRMAAGSSAASTCNSRRGTSCSFTVEKRTEKDGNPMRVLVVAGCREERLWLTAELQRGGDEAVALEDSRAAWPLLRAAERPELLVLDGDLQGTDTLET